MARRRVAMAWGAVTGVGVVGVLGPDGVADSVFQVLHAPVLASVPGHGGRAGVVGVAAGDKQRDLLAQRLSGQVSHVAADDRRGMTEHRGPDPSLLTSGTTSGRGICGDGSTQPRMRRSDSS